MGISTSVTLAIEQGPCRGDEMRRNEHAHGLETRDRVRDVGIVLLHAG